MRVEWSYPGFFTDLSGTATLFPTYLDRLFAPAPAPTVSIQFVTACATLNNTTASAQSVDISVAFPGFGATATQTIGVPSMGTVQQCMNPLFDFAALGNVRTATPSGLQVSAALTGSSIPISSSVHSFSLLASNDIMYVPQGMASFEDMRSLSAVFVRPNDPSVMSLRSEAEHLSAWQTFGTPPFAHLPANPRRWRFSVSLMPRYHVQSASYFEAGEAVNVYLDSSDQPVSIYVMTDAEYGAFMSGTPTTPEMAITGATGPLLQLYTAPSDGMYHVVVQNPAGAPVAANVVYGRDATYLDVDLDVLSAVFIAAQSHSIVYSNINENDMAGVQSVRTPADTLAMRAGNCIDGTLLFASVFEEIGFDPSLLYYYGCPDQFAHAIVAVHAPGSRYYYPIETTMVGTSATPVDAISSAMNTGSDHAMCQHVFDVAELRARHITPGM